CHGAPEAWARLNPWTRMIVQLQQTLAGRVTIGVFWAIGRFLSAESRAVIRNQDGVRAVWLEHLLWCIPVIVWVKIVCGIPLSIYVLAMAIPGTALTLIRRFLFRAHDAPRHPSGRVPTRSA